MRGFAAVWVTVCGATLCAPAVAVADRLVASVSYEPSEGTSIRITAPKDSAVSVGTFKGRAPFETALPNKRTQQRVRVATKDGAVWTKTIATRPRYRVVIHLTRTGMLTPTKRARIQRRLESREFDKKLGRALERLDARDARNGGGGGTGLGRGTSASDLTGIKTGAIAPADKANIIIRPAVGKLGGLTPETVKMGIRSQRKALYSCYGRRLMKKPTLGGRIELTFVVANGKPVRVSVSSSTLGDRATEDCFSRVLKRIIFPSAPLGAATFRVPLELYARPPMTLPGSPGRPPPQPPAGLSQDQIRKVITDHRQEFRRCYQRELQRMPGLSGRIVVEFKIAAHGRVTSARVRSSTMKSRPVEDCLVRQVRRLRFPRSNGPSAIKFPFVFNAPP